MRGARLDEEVLHAEEREQHPHDGRDLLAVVGAGRGVDRHVGDDAERDALGDRVHERHGDDRDEGGNRLGRGAPLDLGDGAEHHEADDDEGGRGRERRYRQEDRRQEEREQEEDGAGHAREAGAAALGDAGGALDRGRRRRGADEAREGRRERLGEKGAPHVGKLALLVQQVGPGGRADERADGVEEVGEEEGDLRRASYAKSASLNRIDPEKIDFL